MNPEREEKKLHKQQKKLSRRRSINKDILKITIGISVLFIAMVLFFVYFIEFKSSAAINNTYNKRADDFKEKVVRGNIYAKGGTELLAETILDEDGKESRHYPYGSLFSHVVGYDSHGGLGLENSYMYYMLSSNINILGKLENEFQNKKGPGNSIVTSLDIGLQQTINDALSGTGDSAAIALDPVSGEILAVVSKPDFDPNTIDASWKEITADKQSSVLVNRATQGLYAPGSTFKVFTLDAFLRQNPNDYSKYKYNCSGEYEVDGMTMHCFDHTSHGKVDLEKSLAYSCNCSFANIGISLNISQFRQNNKRLYFNSELPLDLPYSKSSFVMKADASKQEIVQTAIGQGNTLVTPVHLGIIMSAIANDGILMKPHLVTEVINANGSVVKTFPPKEELMLFEHSENNVLCTYLRDVVKSGTANLLADANYIAYGKTGTAETVSNFNADKEASDHSWFAGWADKDGRKIVLCVLIEKAQNTQASACQLARQIFDYYFRD